MLYYFAFVKSMREETYLHFSHISVFFWSDLEQVYSP